MANPARNPDPVDPETRSTDPLAPDPRATTTNSKTVNRVESRSAGTGILIAAVVIVLALIAYFAFAPGDEVDGVPGDATVTEQPADVVPAPDATAPAAPADTAPADTAPAPDATAPEAPADTTAPAPESSAPADTTAPAPESSAPADTAPAPAE